MSRVFNITRTLFLGFTTNHKRVHVLHKTIGALV